MDSQEQAIHEFAEKVRAFCAVLENPPDDRYEALRLIYERLVVVYAGVLELKDEYEGMSEELLGDEYRVSSDECLSINGNVQRVVGNRAFYRSNPDPIFPERNENGEWEVSVGWLPGDLDEIYHDPMLGLRALEAGNVPLADVRWQWRAFPCFGHWGLHALEAIHALHFLVFDHGLGDPEEKDDESRLL